MSWNRSRVLALAVAALGACMVIAMTVLSITEIELHTDQHTLGHNQVQIQRNQHRLAIDNRKLATLRQRSLAASSERRKLRRLVQGLQDQVRSLGLQPFALPAPHSSTASTASGDDESPAPRSTTSPTPRKTRGSSRPPRTPSRSPSPTPTPRPSPTPSPLVCRLTGICPHLPKGVPS